MQSLFSYFQPDIYLPSSLWVEFEIRFSESPWVKKTVNDFRRNMLWRARFSETIRGIFCQFQNLTSICSYLETVFYQRDREVFEFSLRGWLFYCEVVPRILLQRYIMAAATPRITLLVSKAGIYPLRTPCRGRLSLDEIATLSNRHLTCEWGGNFRFRREFASLVPITASAHPAMTALSGHRTRSRIARWAFDSLHSICRTLHELDCYGRRRSHFRRN